MPNTLYGEAAGLLRGAAETKIAGEGLRQKDRALAAETAQSGLKVAGGLVERKMAEEGALQREQLQQEKQFITLTPELAKGAAQVTGDESWNQAVGQKLPVAAYSALLIHGHTKDIANNYDFQDAVEGDNTQTYLLNRRTGDRIPIGKAGKGGKGRSAASGMSADDKEFIKTYRQYAKDTEGFNYEMAKGLATTDPKQSDDLTSKLDFIDTNQKRFNDLQGVKTPVDTVGPAAETSQLPAPAIAALKQRIGEPVTFKNGQSWMMDKNGKVERVN
jgi:hypothetical protein